ncbi:MAG TPA: Hsp20/alpha crystallin family protein [bacterium]|nr:Hsp20/alpha crystallin family protein [bacterium]
MLDQFKKWLPFKRGDKSARRVADVRDTAHPLARVEQDLRQLFERFGFGSLWSTPFGADRQDSWFGDFSPALFSPTLDVVDKRKHLEIRIELPGMDPEDIEIDVRDGALVVRGEKRSEEATEDEGFYRTERSFGAFERVIPLPAEVDAEHTEATFKKGVLKVRLPKVKPEPSAKKITIRSA